MPAGLYLHVPFCQSKCHYCDFYSITDSYQVKAFIAALKQEVGLNCKLYQEFDTLYLGGGTPSLLTAADLTAILTIIRDQFSFFPDSEITLEANPDDVTPEKLRLWKELGVNRLSLGVQSLNDDELQFLGRRHTAIQARQAISLAREAGFDNLGIDLIYALPGQTEAGWLATLQAVLAYEPEHISCYQLTIEEKTPLGKQWARGEIAPASEEQQRTFFLHHCRKFNKPGATCIMKSPTSPGKNTTSPATIPSIGSRSLTSAWDPPPTPLTAGRAAGMSLRCRNIAACWGRAGRPWPGQSC